MGLLPWLHFEYPRVEWVRVYLHASRALLHQFKCCSYAFATPLLSALQPLAITGYPSAARAGLHSLVFIVFAMAIVAKIYLYWRPRENNYSGMECKYASWNICLNFRVLLFVSFQFTTAGALQHCTTAPLPHCHLCRHPISALSVLFHSFLSAACIASCCSHWSTPKLRRIQWANKWPPLTLTHTHTHTHINMRTEVVVNAAALLNFGWLQSDLRN